MWMVNERSLNRPQFLIMKLCQIDLAKVFDILLPLNVANHSVNGQKKDIIKGIRDFCGLAVIVDFTEQLGTEGTN